MQDIIVMHTLSEGTENIQDAVMMENQSGTAGRPMLDVILGEDIYNIAVVVTRYFGGVLLGTGGLVRAISKADTEGLSESL